MAFSSLYLWIFTSSLLLLLLSIDSINGNKIDQCDAIQRKLTALLDDGRAGAHTGVDEDQGQRVLCPSSTMNNEGDDEGRCCTNTIRQRLIRQRVKMDLTEWTLDSINTRLVQRIEQSLAVMGDLVRSQLSTSEQRLHHMFDDAFPQAARPARSIIDRFFRSLLDELTYKHHQPSSNTDDSYRPPFETVIDQAVVEFFSELFPPVYACIWSMHCHERGYALTTNYSRCVAQNMRSIEPFGDTPRRLRTKLIASGRLIADSSRYLTELSSLLDPTKSMDSTEDRGAPIDHARHHHHRSTDQSTTIHPTKRAAWARLWSEADVACRAAMFQLTYCPLCRDGNHSGSSISMVRPCQSACQSTVQLCVERDGDQGALARIDRMLNEGWTRFQQRAINVLASNQASMILERVLDEIGIDIQEAITNGFGYENGASTISTKVVDLCGPIQNRLDETAAANGMHAEKKRGSSSKGKNTQDSSDEKMQVRSTPIETQGPIVGLIAGIAKNLSSTFTGYFGRKLATVVCADRSIDSNNPNECWNPSRYSQSSVSSSSMPESGLEKAAAASAVAAGSDASITGGASNQRQPTDVETRLKRITDTIHRVRGPDLDGSTTDQRSRQQSERLVVADRASVGASQSPFMMRQDELRSSGDGSLGDDDDDDEGGDDGANGEFGSGDDDPMFGGGSETPPIDQPRRTGSEGASSRGESGPPLGGSENGDIYPEEAETRKPVHTTSTTSRRPPIHRGGATKQPPHVESVTRHPTKAKPAGSSARSSLSSSWSSIFLCLSISSWLLINRTLLLLR